MEHNEKEKEKKSGLGFWVGKTGEGEREKKETTNGKYILGLFIDRCFIPIPNKETFEKIWDKLNKE